MNRYFLMSFLFLHALYSSIEMDLKNPVYQDGSFYTNEGGVIAGEEIRIQAQKILYTKDKKKHSVEAEGDLMIQYKGKVFVGEKLVYDFTNKTGYVCEGKTSSGIWFVGGNIIEMQKEGGYVIEDAYISASENKKSKWDIHASKIEFSPEDLLAAENVTFRIFQVPTLWVPFFKLNLKKKQPSILRYKIDWDKKQGPKVSARYEFYSWRDFALFGRLEYRWGTGWGGALESEYFPKNPCTSFVTRSYVGTDRLQTAPNKQFRYRLEGAYHWKNEAESTETKLLWDKYSDVRMPNDFASDDFEIGTAKQTLFWIRHKEPWALFDLKARPRVNVFESIKQDLPTFYSQILPFQLGNTKILFSSWLKASYLDFAYSNQLAAPYPLVQPQDYRSGRFEFKEDFLRSFYFGPWTFTPFLSAIGILYSNSPSHKIKPLGTLQYGAHFFARAERTFEKSKHVLEPYASIALMTKPTVAPSEHYIFSIQDGYNKINQVQAGIKSYLFERKTSCFPYLTVDLYANAFFSDPVIPQFIPRLYLSLHTKLPSVDLFFYNAWNFRNHILDFSIAKAKWTISENIAFSLEARYRSRYDWRKADHDNFTLDVTQSESNLLSSPLSDRRVTLLTNLFVRLSPFWECHFQSHHGFYRLTEDPYNEFNLNFFTWLQPSLKLRISYSHTDKDDRVSTGLFLVK